MGWLLNCMRGSLGMRRNEIKLVQGEERNRRKTTFEENCEVLNKNCGYGTVLSKV